MKIELKRVRIHRAMSEETLCFEAVVYIDDQRAGTVMNRGCGGCHDYAPHSLGDRLQAHADALGPRTFKLDDREFTVAVSADSLIYDAVEDWELHQKFRRLESRCFLFTKPGDDSIYQVTKMKAAPERHRDHLRAKGYTLLSDMPEGQAFDLWKARCVS